MVAGYADKTTTEKIINFLVSAGLDIIEIGIHFSDPTTDNQIIQETSCNALSDGITRKKVREFM